MDPAPTLVDLLRERAALHPDRKAFTFVHDGAAEETITFGELDREARRFAVELAARGARGERVLLLYPPGLPYIAAFFGCLYAGSVAVPAYPPDAAVRRSLPRLLRILEDSGAAVAMTTAAVWEAARPLLDEAPGLAGLRWISAGADDAAAEAWRRPEIDGETLAFLQYTSGSTGHPRGVMLSHANLLHNQRLIQHAFAHGPSTVVAGWLPLYHDMGLIGNMLQPVYLGVPCVLMSPRAFLRRPLRWLQMISRHRATTSGAPNFAFELCVKKHDPAQLEGVDLGSWDLAFCGAEPIRADTLDRFCAAYAPYGFRREAFYPCYGLAEATLIVSGGDKRAAPVVTSGPSPLVGCGRALLDEQLLIVDPRRREACAEGQEGEVWIASPSVSRGYWGRRAANEATFGARLASGEGPFLATGDLGFLRAGELFITGRSKDLIIIRGRNLHPQDLERTVEGCDPALQLGLGAAFGADVDGEERLVIVHEADLRGGVQPNDLLLRIRQAVAEEHDVSPAAVVLIKRGTIPKTSSGKIQRHACRVAYHEGGLEALAHLGPLPAQAAGPAASG